MLILIDVITSSQREKVSVESDHLFYNDGKMTKLRGGTLKYHYANGKVSVSVEPLFVTTTKTVNNKKSILDFIETLANVQLVDENDRFVAIGFDKNHLQQVESDLYEKRFAYEIIEDDFTNRQYLKKPKGLNNNAKG
jgi:hypothetical protein